MALLPLLALAACEAPPPADRLVTVPVGFADLPGWRDDAVAEAIPPFLRSCATLDNKAADRAVGRDGRGGLVADWLPACAAARRLSAGDHVAARAFFETWFQPYRALAGDIAEGTFTGYYEAELRGALRPDQNFRWPVYGRPADLVTVDLNQFIPDWRGGDIVGRLRDGRLEPYPKRPAIEAGAVVGKAPVLFWADDPVDVLLLHIQGSGRVHLADGRTVRVGFAASNGHKFVGIGKTLLDKGKIGRDQATMPAIVGWLRANPGEARMLVDENPRYIFFKMQGEDGPIGAQGVVLTAGRSMAVDSAHVPLGAPLWLDTTTPDGAPLRRLVVAQDTGAAIKGPVRGDFFWGHGPQAFDNAGRMKSRGGYYLLLPAQRTAHRLAAADRTLAPDGTERHPTLR